MALTFQELQSPVMAEMLRVDAEARTPEGKQRVQRYARAIQVAPPSDERISLIQTFDEKAGNSAFAIDTMVAVSRGMMTGLGAPPEVTAEIEKHRGEIGAQIQKIILLSLSAAYRNVNRTDLDRFAKELNSQPVKGFYDQVKKSFVEMMEVQSVAIGKDLKVLLESQQKKP